MRALMVVSLGGTAVACATVLGGLDDGRGREPPIVSDASALPPPDANANVADCHSVWRSGFDRRVRYEIDSLRDAPIRDYVLPLPLDTRRLIERGRLRPDGADMLVTGDDGISPIPFTFGGAIDSEAAKIWVRVDLVAKRSRIFVYVGGAREDTTEGRAVFFDGVVPPFEPTSGSWTSNHASNFLSESGATALAKITAESNATVSEWCADASFPEGHDWEIVFDVTPHARTAGTFQVTVDQIIRFSSTDGAPFRDARARAIPPKRRSRVCFGVALPPTAGPGDEIGGTFSAPRVRIHTSEAPIVTAVTEETPCEP